MSRQIIKDFVYFFSKPLPFNLLRKLTGENFIFPFYHLVADNTPIHIKNLYPAISVEHFKNDLEFLLKNYHPATINDVLAFVENGKKSEKPLFFLSFDDGMRECYDVIFPILKQKGLQSAFFINPAFVDNKTLFYKHKISLIIEALKVTKENFLVSELMVFLDIFSANNKQIIETISRFKYSDTSKIDKIGKILKIDFESYLKKEKPYLTLSQVLEMQDNGFIIGSHSNDHPKFWEISEFEMQNQLEQSFNYLNKNIYPQILSFAFPFSDINVPFSFFQFLDTKIKIELSFGTSGIKKDVLPKHIHRVPMEDNLKNATRIIRSEYAYFLLKSIFRKNTINRQ